MCSARDAATCRQGSAPAAPNPACRVHCGKRAQRCSGVRSADDDERGSLLLTGRALSDVTKRPRAHRLASAELKEAYLRRLLARA